MCTVGPKTNQPQQVAALINQGVSTIRVNFSHGTTEDHVKFIQIVREGASLAGKPVKLMGDIQGPKFRVGKIRAPFVTLQKGQEYLLDSDSTEGDERRCYLPHPEFMAAAAVGEELLLNDGLIELEIVSCNSSQIVTRVLTGGELSSGKGISMPNKVISTEFPTAKDLVSIDTALKHGLDVLMLSFIQCCEDVKAVRKITGDRLHLMAKIETPAAIRNLDSIAKESDSILVARGDLGVEARMHNVPEIQEQIVAYCKKENKICIVATQCLESLVKGLTPTRAEVNDIYTSVQQGVSGILLTGETANGCDPLNAITWLRRIIEKAYE